MNPVFFRLFLCTPEISGEFRGTVMLSRARSAVGIKPLSNRCGDLTRNRLEEIFRLLIGYAGYEFAPKAKKTADLH